MKMAKVQPPFELSESALVKIRIALTQLSIFRGANLDKEILSLFSKRLLQENYDDVISALAKLQEMPREQGEPALPDIGTILTSVRMQANIRKSRAVKGRVELVTWNCPKCGVRSSGHLEPEASKQRSCRSFYGPRGVRPSTFLPRGKTCGAAMNWAVYRDCDDENSQG